MGFIGFYRAVQGLIMSYRVLGFWHFEGFHGVKRVPADPFRI